MKQRWADGEPPQTSPWWSKWEQQWFGRGQNCVEEINRGLPGAREVFLSWLEYEVHRCIYLLNLMGLYFIAYICTFKKPYRIYTLNRTLQSNHLKVAWNSMIMGCSRITEYSCWNCLCNQRESCVKNQRTISLLLFLPKTLFILIDHFVLQNWFWMSFAISKSSQTDSFNRRDARTTRHARSSSS